MHSESALVPVAATGNSPLSEGYISEAVLAFAAETPGFCGLVFAEPLQTFAAGGMWHVGGQVCA